MEKGKSFETVDEVFDYVNKFARDNYHPLWQRNCVTVESYNKKVSVQYWLLVWLILCPEYGGL